MIRQNTSAQPETGKPRRKRLRKPVPQSAWHPSNWGQCITIGFLWLLARLPWHWALMLGRGLGQLLGPLARERQQIARRNLELCFPDLSADHRQQLLTQNTRAVGQAIAETALAWYGGPSVDRIPCRVTGEEHLRLARNTGRGRVILLSGHFLSLEMAARLIPGRIGVAGLYKPMRKRPVMDRAMLAARERSLGVVLARDEVRALVRAISNGYALWFAGDQDYSRRHSVFAPFFGTPANTITTLSRLSRMSHALVVPMFFFREPDGGYLIEFQPPLEGFPDCDEVENAARMNRIVEAAARRYPDQYLWMHRRFKRQPMAETNHYKR